MINLFILLFKLLFIWTINKKKSTTNIDISTADNNSTKWSFNFPFFSSEMKAAWLDQNPSRDPDKITQEISRSELFIQNTHTHKKLQFQMLFFEIL